MPISAELLQIDHDLQRLGTEDVSSYIAHILCLQGELRFTFDGRAATLQAGQSMIVVLNRLIEELHPSADLEVRCIYISSPFIERCTPRSNYGLRGTLALYSDPVMPMDTPQQRQLRESFDLIEHCLQAEGHHFQEDRLIVAVQMMILDFFDIHTSLHGQVAITDQEASIMERFLQLLEQGEYVKHREVSYYADKLFITAKYLSETCKIVSGQTAIYWISRFTIIHIRRLLQEKELSFTEIADLFEFSSTAYFSRFVMKHLGVSPSALRG